MLILALDTSSAAGSAAIVRDGALAIEREGDPSRTHGQRLPLELMAILNEAHVALAEVDAFAVVTGPGSFTGLRVGIATIQGLALARGRRVAPVSAFEALVFPAAGGSGVSGLEAGESCRAVWIDAHRREVFAALYASDGRTVLEPPTSLSPEATIENWIGRIETGARVHFAGDGAVRYADVIRAGLGERAVIPGAVPPLAGAAGLIAAADPARAVAPHALVPLYVRRSDAELARDRARSGSAVPPVPRR
ncbi:MAG TPA: tRNA (adenosine(37)-N6)-threonylcarbamoyltransferase complex dimerization subunit type 1 TsaB [Vicinamibacterales bacterium]|nr:tRNA (adenosine(37)-N6)-threonylcarbamoyltransferase complex dimerization subunit type 1 TsaB [Vicinamibacterales bacterium]